MRSQLIVAIPYRNNRPRRTQDGLPALLAAVVFVCSTAYCEPPDRVAHNIVLVVIDALRADHLGCYGYERNTSPFIDSLAREGLVFDCAYSNSSYTRESVASLFTGQLPSHSGAVGWHASPPEEAQTLAECLRSQGYRTGSMSNSIMIRSKRFQQGFDSSRYPSAGQMLSGGGPPLTRSALDFVRNCGEEKFFLYLHYLDPHGPYEPPDSYYLRYADSVFPEPVPLYGHIRNKCFWMREEGFGPGEPRFEDLVLRYDAEIAHVDDSLRALFAGLRKQGKLDNTLVVVTADHGEEFLEHGYVEHAWTVYAESLRIPLLFWRPGLIAAERVVPQVSWVDLLPTLLGMTGAPSPPQPLDGTPLLQEEGGRWTFADPGTPIIAEMLIQSRCLVRSVILGDWKYNAAHKWVGFPERERLLPQLGKLRKAFAQGRIQPMAPWAPLVLEELYHLSEDPGEETNLLEDGPAEKLELMRCILRSYQEKCQRKTEAASPLGPGEEPVETVDEESLRALGYL